jgi:hypothetical protein
VIESPVNIISFVFRGPNSHGRVDLAVHLGDGDLAEVTPAERVPEEVVPLLQHARLGGRPRPAVDPERRVLVGTLLPLGGRESRPHVVPGGEHRAGPAKDDHAHPVVGLGCEEGLVQLHQEAPVLGVAGLRPVEGDPCDPPVVQRLVGDEAEVGHGIPSPELTF